MSSLLLIISKESDEIGIRGENYMKKMLITVITLALCAWLPAMVAYPQEAMTYDRNGITFIYPSEGTLKESTESGGYDQVACTTPGGSLFSVAVYRKKIDPSKELGEYRRAFESQYRSMGARDLSVINSSDPQGWRMTFAVKDRKYALTVAYYEFPQAAQVIIVKQYRIAGAGAAEPPELTRMMKSLQVK